MNLVFPANCTLICSRALSGDWADYIGKYVIIQRTNHELMELTCKKLSINKNNDFELLSQSTNEKYKDPIIVKNIDGNCDQEITILGHVIRSIVEF